MRGNEELLAEGCTGEQPDRSCRRQLLVAASRNRPRLSAQQPVRAARYRVAERERCEIVTGVVAGQLPNEPIIEGAARRLIPCQFGRDVLRKIRAPWHNATSSSGIASLNRS